MITIIDDLTVGGYHYRHHYCVCSCCVHITDSSAESLTEYQPFTANQHFTTMHAVEEGCSLCHRYDILACLSCKPEFYSCIAVCH